MKRCYSDLSRLMTLEDRFAYLNLSGRVGEATFGSERFLNQRFYRSAEWQDTRNEVINRDRGCDLGISDFPIYDRIYIHHMNPMTRTEILNGDPAILNPEFLISVTFRTHQAIHYGDERQLPRPLIERQPGDTTLW